MKLCLLEEGKKPDNPPKRKPHQMHNPKEIILISKYVFIFKFSQLLAYWGNTGWNELLRIVMSFPQWQIVGN